jgi:hypothetical protein
VTVLTRIALAIACAAAAAAAGPAHGQPSSQDTPVDVRRLIDGLDALVQARFLDTDLRFGMSRIAEPGDFHQTLRRFRPENAQEVAAVAGLERAGLAVALYLSGRSLLSQDVSAPASSVRWPRRAMAGPVLVTPTQASAARDPDLPEPTSLSAHARHAFDVFTRTDRLSFERDEWRFEARPIRASRAECLECHRAVKFGPAPRAPLRIGDTLGVVLYGYSVIPCRLCS